MDITSYLKERARLVDESLARILDLHSEIFGTLIQSMRYSLFAGGKRVRPILALAACDAVGGRLDDALPVACALELIHTYTLIHDDMPCMDNDDFRRGIPTNHKVFGEAQALLSGCSLLTLAFEIVADQALRGEYGAERSVRAIRILADAIGWQGVIGGQSLDIESTGKPADLERVRTICHYKTATLIAASVTAGATAAGGTAEQIASLEKFGTSIGLAFQVADDILNVEGDASKLGKGTGTDKAVGKTTFPDVLSLDGAKTLAAGLLAESLTHLETFGPRAESLRRIANYIVTRDR